MSATKTKKATKSSGSKSKATGSKPTKSSKAKKATQPETAPAQEVESASATEPEAVPPSEPKVASTAEARTCANCGATEFDEDGDCAKCHEPAPKAKAGKKPSDKKATGKKKAATEPKPKKLSAIDAAAQVLVETKQPMNTREMIAAMTEKNLWTSPGGKTPHATLYSAILREINVKGKDSRFTKTERGRFAANSAA